MNFAFAFTSLTSPTWFSCEPGDSSGKALDYKLERLNSISGGGSSGDFHSFFVPRSVLRSTDPGVEQYRGFPGGKMVDPSSS